MLDVVIDAVLPRQAIVLRVPAPVAARVDEMRRRFDPVMAARIDPHITLVHEVTDRALVPELVCRAAERDPFVVRLTHADRWGPSRFGTYLHVDDPDGAVHRLHGAVAELEAASWARADFRPHVTLVHGRTVSESDAEAAWQELDGFVADWDVTIDAIDVIELVEPRWRPVERRPLQRT